MVDWASVCKPKTEGGLHFISIRVTNTALLRKWLWRLGNEAEGLWRQLLIAKYKVARDGCELKEALPKHSDFWEGIMSIKESFIVNIKLNVGSGENNLFFWLDTLVAILLWLCNFRTSSDVPKI